MRHGNSQLLLAVWLSFAIGGKAQRKTKLFAQNVGLLVDTRLDPLVNPNECSSHVHSVYGNAKFGKQLKGRFFKDNDWRNTVGKEDQTTSEVIPNLSSYWAPSLYIWDQGTQMYYLTPSFVRTYYRIHGERSTVNPYPPLFSMIVGDASRQAAWQPNETDRDHIRWTLTTHNRKQTNHIKHGDWTYLYDQQNLVASRGQVEMLLEFPSCVEVDQNGDPKTSSSDFRSHVAYPVVGGVDCPDTHPYKIPKLTMETRFDLKPMRDRLGDAVVNDARNWRLSTGDDTGAGAHADFVSGWPEEMMINMITNCTDGVGASLGNGETADCILEEYDLDGRERKSVPYGKKVPDEEVHEVSVLPSGSCPPFKPYKRNIFEH